MKTLAAPRRLGRVAAIAALSVASVAAPMGASASGAPTKPDITVRKTASVASTSYYGYFRYVIVVSNTGGTTANNVKLSDFLPYNVHFNDDEGFIAGGQYCSIEYGGGEEDEYENVVRCEFGSIAPRATRTVVFEVHSHAYSNDITNTAKGTTSTPESNYTNNSSTAVVTSDGCRQEANHLAECVN